MSFLISQSSSARKILARGGTMGPNEVEWSLHVIRCAFLRIYSDPSSLNSHELRCKSSAESGEWLRPVVLARCRAKRLRTGHLAPTGDSSGISPQHPGIAGLDKNR